MSSGGGSGYTYSLTTFSRTGKLAQIEHALAAVEKGGASVGVLASNGAVVATERRAPSKLAAAASVERVAALCPSIGVVYSGMGPDARVVIGRARRLAASYALTYGEEPSVAYMVRELAGLMQEYTQSGGVRPFGVSLLVAGVDPASLGGRAGLYQVDPSGAGWAWRAAAIGRGQAAAKAFLEKRYPAAADAGRADGDAEREEPGALELQDAVHLALLALKENFEGAMDAHNVEVGVARDGAFVVLPPADVADHLANL